MRNRSRTFVAARWAVVAIGTLFALAACQASAVPEPNSTPPPSPSPIPVGYAGNPVTANSQWTPLIQQFGGVEMVLVPAGCFMMGSSDEQLKAAAETTGQELDWITGLAVDEQPASQICFGQPFWMDRLEVTNVQFAHFDGQAEHESEWDGDYRPRETISQKEAQDFCEKRGMRLPTEAEWEYGARGPDDLLFPWGNEFVADDAFYLDNSGRRTWDVGERLEGASWVGALNMAGNVEEWTSSAYEPYPYSSDHEKGVEDGLFTGAGGVIRGGGWYTENYMLRTAVRNRLLIPELADAVGFRCARSTTDPQADMLAAAATTATITTTPNLTVEETDLLARNPLPSSYNGPLPEGAVAQLGLGVLSVSSVSPGGEYVALGTQTSVLVYRADTLEIVWTFANPYTSHLAWTHDGTRLAANSWNNIAVYEISSGHTLLKMPGNSYFSDFAWTPDDRFLVSTTSHGAVEVWDGATGQKLRSMVYHETPRSSEYPEVTGSVFSLSPDGKMAAIAYTYSETGSCCLPGRSAVVWDVVTGARLLVIEENIPDSITELFSFAWSPDSKTLAVNVNVGAEFSGIEFWNPLTGKKVGEIDCGYRYDLSWSPDGKKLLAYEGTGSQVIDTGTYQRLFQFDLDYGDELLGWSGDSTQFVLREWRTDKITIMDSSAGVIQSQPSTAGGSNSFTSNFKFFFFLDGAPSGLYGDKPYRSLVKWNASTDSIEKILATGLALYVSGVSWSPDSANVAFSIETEHAQVVIWDVKANKAVASLDSGSGSHFMQWSPNGKIFANVLYNNIADLYDTSTWQPLNTISINTDTFGYMRSIDWAPDSNQIAVETDDAKLLVMDVLEGRSVFQKETLDRYSIVSWSIDGKQIATVGAEGHIEVWNSDTGERLKVVSGPSVEVTDLISFSPDLSMLASAGDCQQSGWCNSAKIWSTATGQLLHTFTGASIAFSGYSDTLWSPWLPDGSELVLYINKSVGLYDPQTGKLLKTLPALPDAFSPDGRLFATYDRIVTLWAVPN